MPKTFNIFGQRLGGEAGVFSGLGLKETNFKDAEIIVFTGGADVHPSWYQEKPIDGCYYNIKRDEEEIEALWEAWGNDKWIVGICRGGQLIHVAQGGQLWQHVNNHGRSHHILDIPSGKVHFGSSCHHQMMLVDIHDNKNKFKVVSIASEATMRLTRKVKVTPKKDEKFRDDIECLWYPESKMLCYQGHPEFGIKSCTEYFNSLMNRYGFLDNPPDSSKYEFPKHETLGESIEISVSTD